MKIEDLQRFCGDRTGITIPWSRGKFTYATEGHIIVRVPRMAEVKENPLAPDATGLGFEREVTKWLPVPGVSPKPPIECEECGGHGTVECPTCGEGELKCMGCRGTGKKINITVVKIGKMTYAANMLGMIAGLPSVNIEPIGEYKAARFIFDGGDGLIMPYKEA